MFHVLESGASADQLYLLELGYTGHWPERQERNGFEYFADHLSPSSARLLPRHNFGRRPTLRFMQFRSLRASAVSIREGSDTGSSSENTHFTAAGCWSVSGRRVASDTQMLLASGSIWLSHLHSRWRFLRFHWNFVLAS